MLATHLNRSLTLLVTLWISSLPSCALFNSQTEPEPSFGPRARVFYASFDEVWQATQKSLARYPLRVNNMDLGLLETDTIKGPEVWTAPHKPKKVSGGLRYRLKLRLVKGSVDEKPSVKVAIIKEMTKVSDFFSKPKKLPSDGLEEKALLYRINREIVIERALQRAHKKSGQNSGEGF